MIDIDASGFDKFAGDIAAAVSEVGAGIPKVVGKGALNVKTDWNDAFRGSTHFKGAAGSVSYDTRTGQGWTEAEIGPDRDWRVRPGKKAGPGAIAVVAHFGDHQGGGGTVADPQTFLDAEEPKLTKALQDLIDQALA